MFAAFKWWHGDEEKIPFSYIRQIPGVKGIVSYFETPLGEVVPLDDMLSLKARIEAAGLTFAVIESIEVDDEIKYAGPGRDRLIENYIQTIINAGKAGIPVVCYNFMPVFSWLRTDLARTMEDGSSCLAVSEDALRVMKPMDFIREVGHHIPGWEPDLLGPKFLHLMERFQDVDEEALWRNLGYFLDAILPAAEKAGVRMAIHPDDPPWPVFGLPRIITGLDSYRRLFELNRSPANGVTICSGSLGADRRNDVPAIIRYVGGEGRLFFGHVRNVRHLPGMSFEETAHLSAAGSLDLYEIMRAYSDIGYRGPIRPDHGRMIWGEKEKPGYGLYDRAMGIYYVQGLWEAIEKGKAGRPAGTAP